MELQEQQHFNSIKVRLELKRKYIVEMLHQVFQFHKGTIRTFSVSWVYSFYYHFNSIKVRLEHCSRDGSSTDYSYFNSIKVRLEPERHNAVEIKFNFNSIKVRLELYATYKLVTADSDFNSIKVRLEQDEHNTQVACVNISIP